VTGLPKRGDIVDIRPEDLSMGMSHFPTGRAVVLDSYRVQYGGGPENDRLFTVMFDDGREVSWYKPENFVFVRHAGEAYIAQLQAVKDARDKQASDLDWVVAHWPEARKRGAALCTLMALLGVTEPWGSHGEAFTYYANVHGMLMVLEPALGTGDVAQVRAAAAEFKARTKRGDNGGGHD
jgi:hypothetical protein